MGNVELVQGVEVQRISSLDIAEITGKLHGHVMRDIKNQLNKLGIPQSKFGSGYKDVQGQERPCYILDNEQAMTLASGYDVVLRNKIIKRWFLLEKESFGSDKPTVGSGICEAATILKANLDVYKMFGVPDHIAQVETVKTVKREIGFDASHFLTHAPAQSNVQEDEMMLEPTELAEKLGFISGIQMNKALMAAGLQYKDVSGTWVATPAGAVMSNPHQWGVTKTGYNLKWRVSMVAPLVEPFRSIFKSNEPAVVVSKNAACKPDAIQEEFL